MITRRVQVHLRRGWPFTDWMVAITKLYSRRLHGTSHIVTCAMNGRTSQIIRTVMHVVELMLLGADVVVMCRRVLAWRHGTVPVMLRWMIGCVIVSRRRRGWSDRGILVGIGELPARANAINMRYLMLHLTVWISRYVQCVSVRWSHRQVVVIQWIAVDIWTIDVLVGGSWWWVARLGRRCRIRTNVHVGMIWIIRRWRKVTRGLFFRVYSRITVVALVVS